VTLPEPIGVDANALIYLFEGGGPRRDFLVKERLGTGLRAVIAVTALAEVLVGRFRQADAAEVAAFRHRLQSTDGFTLLPISIEIAEAAARLRAEYGLGLPDALNLAAAIVYGAAAFLTNDRQLAAINDSPIPILRLDDLLQSS
jgi:predicted nucleic acid-binding protein